MALRPKNSIIQNRKRARTTSSIKYAKHPHQPHHKKHKFQHDHVAPSGKLCNGTSVKAGQDFSKKSKSVKGSGVESVAGDTTSSQSGQAYGGALESAAIKSEDHISRHGLASSSASALDPFLAKPLRFVPATRLTREDELSVVGNMKLLHSYVSDHQLRREKVDSLLHPRQRDMLNGFVKTSKLSSEWLAVHRGKPSGLHNVHNFCYRRSVLQTFLHLPVFSSWLRNHIPSHHCKCSTMQCFTIQG